MKITARHLVAVTLIIGLLNAGCGGGSSAPSVSGDSGVTTTAAAPVLTDDEVVAKGMLDDPVAAMEMIPTRHLDPPLTGKSPARSVPTVTPVATLESDYEALFCALNAKLGVTLTTQQTVDKINFIKSQSQTGYFDLLSKPILNNPLGVTGAGFQPVRYQTTVPLPAGNQTFQVSGGLLMPQGIDKSKVKGVLLYFHATTLNKATVGSNYAQTMEDHLMAQLFVSQGYIVVIPDYVGQGADWQNVHPYVLYPAVTAKTAVDMLTAVKPLITAEYGYAGGDPPLKLFSAGYSEGGAYSLWFNIFLSSTPGALDPFYALTHSVGMEGAYSTSEVTKNFLFSKVGKDGGNPYNIQRQVLVNLVKPILTADAFLSYATYTMGAKYESVFSKHYFALDNTLPITQSMCNLNGNRVNIAQAFAQQSTSCAQPLLFAALGKTANDHRYLGLFEAVTSSENNVYSLASADLLTTEGAQRLQQTLQAADVNLAPCADSGVSIISLAQDSVVVPNNFDMVLAKYPSKIKNAVKIDPSNLMVASPFSVDRPIFVPVDHMQGPIYEFIYALAIFNSFTAP